MEKHALAAQWNSIEKHCHDPDATATWSNAVLSGSRAKLSHAEETHSVELKSCGTATGCFGTALTGNAKQGHREAEQRQS